MSRIMTDRVALGRTLVALVGAMALAPGVASAQAAYKVQPIVKLGDTLGDITLKKLGFLVIGGMNDNGQIIFLTNPVERGYVLFRYAEGQFTLIVVPERDAPGGKWSNESHGGVGPGNINQRGNIVFNANVNTGDKVLTGTFLWDAQTQKASAVALPGMPAVNNLIFEQGSDEFPVINDHDEIAFPATVKNVARKTASGIFFLGRDGKLLPVALPDQELPDGRKVEEALYPTLNDAGAVAFLTVKVKLGERTSIGAYLWEQSTITPLAVIGTDAPGGGKFAAFNGAWVNNKNRSVLLAAVLDKASSGPSALYRFADGKLTPVVIPGQEMPGGGKIKSVGDVSSANGAGQHAFVATLEGNATAAYLLDADGKLSLILSKGMTTDLGTITLVGATFGLAINNRGQIAIGVKIVGLPNTMVLLTPSAP